MPCASSIRKQAILEPGSAAKGSQSSRPISLAGQPTVLLVEPSGNSMQWTANSINLFEPGSDPSLHLAKRTGQGA